MKDPVEVTTRKTIPEPAYRPTQLRLYGVQARSIASADLEIGVVLSPADTRYELAVIYGYAYEGHCYALPRPCVVAVDKNTRGPASGCGFEDDYEIVFDSGTPPPKRNLKYSMWTADKLDRTYEISLSAGFMEEIILQQNVGGPKPPAAYGAKVASAHRGGKLVE